MKKRILIAEDAADMRELLEDILGDAGYEALTASNGYNALMYVINDQERIDLVLTDLWMPQLNGDELLKQVQHLRSSTPVIIITGLESSEYAHNLVKRGAFSYLTKPFATKDLLKYVCIALKLNDENEASIPQV